MFVLATTDPQKVRPTIRSRTQHFEFRLLPPDVLADHVRHVIDDAGLLDAPTSTRRSTMSSAAAPAPPATPCRRSTRWRRSARWSTSREPVDAVLDALCEHDAGGALVAVADALAAGRDPARWAKT